MKIIKPPYELLDMGHREWRFQGSEEMQAATLEFDAILEWANEPAKYTARLHKFLLKHPDHIDGLHHYSMCLTNSRAPLEALAFSQTAVTTGIRIFPAGFTIGKDRLPTGFVQNRPFLRSLHGLMLAQRNVGLIQEAITTGEMCLALDVGDRMGAREDLVFYLLEANHDSAALSLFENPAFAGTFLSGEFLHALALIRMDREADALPILKNRLRYTPQVAKFILNRNLPEPVNDDRLGFVASGSTYEGWVVAQKYAYLWRTNRKAMRLLRRESEQHEEKRTS